MRDDYTVRMTRIQRQIVARRQGEACVEVRDAAGQPCPGVPVWVEQETHAFPFGCIRPDLRGVSETDRRRCEDRLGELFNNMAPAADPAGSRFDIPDAVNLGCLRRELEERSAAWPSLDVIVRGRSLAADPSADERATAERAAELYTLCFACGAVRAITWAGVWVGEPGVDGSGLLRRDFSPRPAFRYLLKLLGMIWHTRSASQTDADGRFRFRGFFGTYRIAAQTGKSGTTVGKLNLSWCETASPSPFLLEITL